MTARLLSLGLAFFLLADGAMGQTGPDAANEPVIQRLLFGSCIQQDRPTPIFQTMLQAKPQLLVFLGDNIYADTYDIDVMRAKYRRLAANKSFQSLRTACPVLATWDDHDYGVNDGGADYPMKALSQQAFLEFWDEASTPSTRSREGIYHAKTFGPPGKRLQVIILDTRYFRSPLKQGPRQLGGPYLADSDPGKTMLGEAQWEWLEKQLQLPAEVRVIASSIQCLAETAGQETWGNLPREQRRLFDLITRTEAGGVLLISGDRHWAELSVVTEGLPYPLLDITSSSFNQLHERGTPTKNRYRAIDQTYHAENFGVISVNWDHTDPTISIEIRDLQNDVRLDRQIRLSELQPRPR